MQHVRAVSALAMALCVISLNGDHTAAGATSEPWLDTLTPPAIRSASSARLHQRSQCSVHGHLCCNMQT